MAATDREIEGEEHPEGGSATGDLGPARSWRILMRRDWRIRAHVRDPGGCTLIVTAARGPVTADVITAEELRSAARRASGVPFKVLGSELGRSTACAASRVQGAMRKLGLASEDELVAFFQARPTCVIGGDPESAGETRLVLTYTAPPWRLPPCLSAAERRVVLGLVAGRSQEAIARDCGVARRTVANHVAAAHRKLGVQSRIELLRALRAPPPGRGVP